VFHRFQRASHARGRIGARLLLAFSSCAVCGVTVTKTTGRGS